MSFEEIGALVDAAPDAVAKRVHHGQCELDALLARAEHTRLRPVIATTARRSA
jgi:hypothetical protein